MTDNFLRRLTDPVFNAIARRFALNALFLVVIAFAIGLAAIPAIALRYYIPGLALFALSRPVAGLAQAAARQSGEPADYALGFDGVVFAGVPFAFALADPSHALASVFLLFAIAALSAGALAIQHPRLLTRNTEIFIGVAVACALPDHYALIAYILGALCFVYAGSLLAFAIAAALGRQRRSP